MTKEKRLAFTLDLEPAYAGLVGEYGMLKDRERIRTVMSLLNSYGIRTTVFVVGRIFESYPDVIKIFEEYGCEFEAHSYSHDEIHQDADNEIGMARQAYFNYFKKYPKGYRAPRGDISPAGVKLLEKHGFLYDSSIFPSYYPNPVKYLLKDRKIHTYAGLDILEIPITSVSPFRITLSLSYLKLLGIKFYFRLFRIFGLPDTVCFNCHLHDFIFDEGSYRKLPIFWKMIYGRNRHSGAEFCGKFLNYMKEAGYRPCFMSELYSANKRGDRYSYVQG